MTMASSRRIAEMGDYAFAEVEQLVARLQAKGISPIDFGVGDPTVPTPVFIREACKDAIDGKADAGYPSYIGDAGFRAAAAGWMRRRFGVTCDPGEEITATIGSKEGVFHLAEGFVNPGDVVIVPTPGYPPYARGARFAEGSVYFAPLTEANGFLMDLDAIPSHVADHAKILWINYPNSPSGRCAPAEFFEKVVAFGRKHHILIASDEAYSEIYYGEKPHSILEFGRKGVVAFFSLSKRSAMTGWRVGWAAGDADVIAVFRKVKTNVDSGTPIFIQDAACAALEDEIHVEEMREDYRKKRDIMVEALKSLGLPDCTPEATLYIWQKIPAGMRSIDFATLLLAEDVGIVTTPGSWISDATGHGLNPGEGYVRFALVPSVQATREAAKKLKNLSL